MSHKSSRRYSVSADENYEPGSNDEVLKNILGIKSLDEIEKLEEKELERAELEILELQLFDENHQFTAEDICNIHELWLGDIYLFAGNYRTVDMEKGGFMFASAARIEHLMAKLESGFLSQYTPCHYSNLDDLTQALGIVHVELILIHPFREGNGRVARLLANLMAAQANLPSLNYSSIDKTQNLEGFNWYILAIHAAIAGNYKPIIDIFKAIIKVTRETIV